MEKERKTEFLQIRVTPTQKEKLKQAAAALSLSVTGFILAECLGEQIGQLIIDGFSKKE